MYYTRTFHKYGEAGTFESTLNKLLWANGLPPVNVPGDVPSGGLFGVKVMSGVGAAASQESITTGGSGFQEEGYEEMMSLGEGAGEERGGGAEGGGERPKERRVSRPRDPRVERLMPQRRTFRSMEEFPIGPIENRRRRSLRQTLKK